MTCYMLSPVYYELYGLTRVSGEGGLPSALVSGVGEHLDEDEVTDYGLIAASRKETITWHGYEIQVPPLDLQLEVSERRGLTNHVEQIKHALF